MHSVLIVKCITPPKGRGCARTAGEFPFGLSGQSKSESMQGERIVRSTFIQPFRKGVAIVPTQARCWLAMPEFNILWPVRESLPARALNIPPLLAIENPSAYQLFCGRGIWLASRFGIGHELIEQHICHWKTRHEEGRLQEHSPAPCILVVGLGSSVTLHQCFGVFRMPNCVLRRPEAFRRHAHKDSESAR